MSIGGEAVEAVQKYNGLWISCTAYPSGQEECYGLSSPEEYTNACIIMMYMSVVLLIFSTFCYFLGAEHTSAFYKDKNAEQQKATFMVVSGILSLICAADILAVAILYTKGVNGEMTNALLSEKAAEMGDNVGSYGTDQAIMDLYYGCAFLITYSLLAIGSSYKTAKEPRYQSPDEVQAYEDKYERASNRGQLKFYPSYRKKEDNFNSRNDFDETYQRDDFVPPGANPGRFESGGVLSYVGEPVMKPAQGSVMGSGWM